MSLLPYAVIGGLVLAIATGGAGYIKGRRDADQSASVNRLEAQLQILRSVVAETSRQAAAQADVAKAATAREAETAKEADDLHRRIEDYASQLARRPDDPPADGTPSPPVLVGNGCALDQRNAGRLLDLAERAGPGDRAPGPAGGAIDLRKAGGGS